jgi:hypothetical protein
MMAHSCKQKPFGIRLENRKGSIGTWLHGRHRRSKGFCVAPVGKRSNNVLEKAVAALSCRE